MSKIYFQAGSIILEDINGYNDKLSINPVHFDWQINNGTYSVRDKLENQSYTLGSFGDIENKFGIPYSSSELLEYDLSLLVNAPNSKSSGATIIKDIIGNDILGTVFGDLITGQRVPSITGQFQYGLNLGNTNPYEDAAIITQSNGGTVSIVNSELLLQSNTDAAGLASIQSNDYVRYLPGFELWVAFTAKFDTPDENGDIQRGGLFDSQNGFFLQYDSTGFYFIRRKSGTDYPMLINTDNIFKYSDFSPELGNIYMIKYGYLGFATIAIVAANPNNGFNEVAKIQYAGLKTTIHTEQTFLPLRAECQNAGAITNKIIKIGSVAAGIVDGGQNYPSTRFFTKAFSGSVAAGTTLIAIFRNKLTFASIENRVQAQLLNFSGAFEGNKPIQLILKRNPTITASGTWNDIDPNSTFEFSINSTINTATGRIMKVLDIGKSGQVDRPVRDLSILLRAGEWASLELITTAVGDYTSSLRWEEQF